MTPNLFGEGEWWEQYWRGMPEFIQNDCEPQYSLQVDLRTQADAEAFQKLIGQRMKAPGKTTSSVWYPEAEIGRFADKCYISAEPQLPKYPVYVISKGRWESRITVRHLERLKVPYHIAVEPQEYDNYAAVIDPKKILVTPFSNLGQGSIPVRNFIWEHSINHYGAERHWCMDDNLNGFFRLNRNLKTPIADPTIFRCAEDWTDRYTNVALSGFQYWMFVSRKVKLAPLALNTRIYSCILINNSIPYRWRGRYNEDTDLSIRALKDGWATALFYAFIVDKETTMTMKGGNTDELYKDDGRRKMAQSLVDQHPDITKIAWKWGRWQHHVDYRGFRKNVPQLKPGVDPQGVDDRGMKLFQAKNWPKSSTKEPWECPELLVPVE